MDPLNDMCDALISINKILQRRKQKIGDNCIEFDAIEQVNSKRELLTDSLLSLKMNTTNLQTSTISPLNKNHQLYFELLTEDNFHRAHLYNRSIDELPNISVHDTKQLKLISIYTIQDLLGRYLIHDTPDEFHTFLIKSFQLSEKTASTITHLLYQWTAHNLDGTVNN